jgi:hypothetical protein
MRLIKSRKWRHCKRCQGDIIKGSMYWPQRNNKAVCFDCATKPKIESFICKVMEWLK